MTDISDSLKPKVKQVSPTMPQGIEGFSLGRAKASTTHKAVGRVSLGTRAWEEVEPHWSPDHQTQALAPPTARDTLGWEGWDSELPEGPQGQGGQRRLSILPHGLTRGLLSLSRAQLLMMPEDTLHLGKSQVTDRSSSQGGPLPLLLSDMIVSDPCPR